MAETVRVMLRVQQGAPWRQASDEEKEVIQGRWNEIFEVWKGDPGIKFISYYGTCGRSLDGYSHLLKWMTL